MNWIDIIVIIILLISIILGCFKGFTSSFISLFGTSVNFTISMFLCKPISNLINKLFNLESMLSSKFSSSLTNMSENFNTPLSTFNNQTELTNHINETINNSSISGFGKKILTSTINITPDNVLNSDITLNQIISNSFATFLTIIISFIITFILLYILLWIISLISKKANQISDIRLTDRILGAVFGLLKGSFIIIFVCILLSLFNENGLLSNLFNAINNSTIGNWYYNTVNTFITKYINIKEITKHIIDKL